MKRMMWPVTIRNENDPENITDKTNGWREAEWAGNEPKQSRKGQFVSLLQFNQSYNMSF